MNRVGHGVMTLGISLCLVGAVATAATSGRSEQVEARVRNAVLPSVPALAPSGPRLEVPVRSGRLDELAPDEESPQPIAVRVAGIALEAPVLPVGVDANNQLAVPSAELVGWYEYSAEPGTAGASVLAAHVDYGGRRGAFWDLEALTPGDVVEVEMDDGTTLGYEVTATHTYDKSDLPASELFRKDGDEVLQLITCGGTFDPVARSYEANVVVTAVPLKA